MIAYIQGVLTSIDAESVIVEASGVGYDICCANPFAYQSNKNKEIRIYTYHYVREDTQMLYGFKTPEEKSLFAKLLNVSGIGPKGALAILASTSVGEVVSAIEREDDTFLTKFPGVGKKTARQMILDLKGKLTEWLPVEQEEGTIFFEGETKEEQSKHLEEAIEAMKALGYSEKELKSIRPRLQEETTTSTDDLVRKGLSLMMQK
ncbi:Holliday junction branch migration protein RuvA [Pontibacillus yanchengensis]|uniref:Holliday junction branch migration protein RuvA n=2 Tax=Pontibacillus yanchengensis TaxID=462910 RepID=A0ACC7VF29_9BACI|nr:Holliday junction branch migration protein RuvA [Pontibacillus yanchengensis]MYL33333.1 Holliday junction branch migration protein RuvA [Pontibacillus yanchengensis]MYL53382.1 Holliday junction branch migration protein RuvA [Pontibacillus yanchengensis]